MSAEARARLARAAVALALWALAAAPALTTLPSPLAVGLGWVPLRLTLGALGALGLWRAARPAADPTPEVPAWAEALGLAAMAAVSAAVHTSWARFANADAHLNGYDYNTYALNSIAIERADPYLYNPDKHAFHARVVAAFWDGGPGLSAVLVAVSVVATTVLPLTAWALARRVGGASAGLAAAAVTLAFPLTFRFTAQTTAYPLFYALVCLAGAAVLAAVQRPSVPRAVLAGVVAGAAAATQEKAAVVLLPVVGLAVLLALPAWWSDARGRLRAAVGLGALRLTLALALYAGVTHLSTPASGYTPLVSLVTNQRRETHDFIPYTWPTIRQVDPADPAGLRAWLPRALWDGELESWVAAARTPPDSNGLRLARADEAGERWRVVPDSTLPPVELRWAANLTSLPLVVGPAPWQGAVLAVGGAGAVLLFGGRRGRVAAAGAGAALSVVAPLTLRFGEHYVLHLVPFAAALAAGGVERLAVWLAPGRAAWAARALVLALFGAYALALWGGSPEAWRRPRTTVPPAGVAVPEDPGGYAGSLQALSAWLDTQPADRPLVDCLPGGLLMARPQDARLSHQLDRACREGLAAPPAGALLLASDHPEYRGPTTPSPAALVSGGRWRVVWAYDRSFGAFTWGSVPPLRSAVVVLEPRSE